MQLNRDSGAKFVTDNFKEMTIEVFAGAYAEAESWAEQGQPVKKYLSQVLNPNGTASIQVNVLDTETGEWHSHVWKPSDESFDVTSARWNILANWRTLHTRTDLSMGALYDSSECVDGVAGMYTDIGVSIVKVTKDYLHSLVSTRDVSDGMFVGSRLLSESCTPQTDSLAVYSRAQDIRGRSCAWAVVVLDAATESLFYATLFALATSKGTMYVITEEDLTRE
jgi:hypothetical protein